MTVVSDEVVQDVVDTFDNCCVEKEIVPGNAVQNGECRMLVLEICYYTEARVEFVSR